MPLAQIRLDLVLRFLNLTAGNRRDLNHVDLRFSGQPLHDGRVRRDDGVVLILSHHVAALLLQDSHDFEGNVLDANDLADGFAVGEKIVHDSLTEDSDFRGGLDVGIGEEVPLRDVPRSNQRIVSADALNGCSPIQLAGDNLRGRADHGGDVSDRRSLGLHPVGIFRGERRLTREDARAALRRRAGKDHDEVCSERVDCGLDRLGSSVADGHDGDDAANADDDPQHGQKRAELVPRDGLQADHGDVAHAHDGVFHFITMTAGRFCFPTSSC